MRPNQLVWSIRFEIVVRLLAIDKGEGVVRQAGGQVSRVKLSSLRAATSAELGMYVECSWR